MGEALKKEKIEKKEMSLKEQIAKLLRENNMVEEIEEIESTDPDYDVDKERDELFKILSKRDLGKPASEIIIEDRR